jgi:hypothetical protein
MHIGEVEVAEEYTSLRIKTATRERLNRVRHELYKDSFDEAINALIDLYEKQKSTSTASGSSR